MNILVCVKQVPDTTEIKIDPVTNTLIRAGVPSIVNPFDRCALEAAARIKDKNPEVNVLVLSMGPQQAQEALRECLSVGGDKAYLVSDRAFGGSDTLATSYILSETIKKLEELEGEISTIFCGKQAIDGDTAQVGPEIAEHLGYPQVTLAEEIEFSENSYKVLKKDDEGKKLIGIQMPCVVTFTMPRFEPRNPSIKSKMAAKRAEIVTLAAADLEHIDLTKAGLKGSPTKVKKTFVPEQNKNCVIIQEESNEKSASKLFDLLTKAHAI